MADPTYVREEIDANPVWHLAWAMSEMTNDNAPIGWGKHIPLAEQLLRVFDLVPKGTANHNTGPLAALRDEVQRDVDRAEQYLTKARQNPLCDKEEAREIKHEKAMYQDFLKRITATLDAMNEGARRG